MAEFIGFAIGSLIEKFPDAKLPHQIYLLGHFLRADLPSFCDLHDQAKLAHNIRSTFVSSRAHSDSGIPNLSDGQQG